MEEAELIIDKYTKTPPVKAPDVAKALKHIYQIVPLMRGIRIQKIIDLRDALFLCICDNYCKLTQRLNVGNRQFMTPASGIFLLCAALSLVSGEHYANLDRSNSVIASLGLFPCVKSATAVSSMSLEELLDSIWLLSLRWTKLRLFRPEDTQELFDYVKDLILRAFYFAQAEIDLGESPRLPAHYADLVAKLPNGKYKSTPRLLLRLCEGLVRPASILRLMKDKLTCLIAPKQPDAKIAQLRKMIGNRTPGFSTVDSFTEQIRDFMEVGSIAPLDYAVYVDKSRDDRYVPHLMLMLARPSQFLARRAWIVTNMKTSELIKVDEGAADYNKNVLLSDHLASMGIKMYAVNSCFESIGIDLICNYLVMEPYLLDKIHEVTRSSAPYLVMVMGMMHVLHKGKLYMCEDGFEQAVVLWSDLVLGDMKGCLGGVNVKKQVESLFKVIGEERTNSQFHWGSVVQI